MNSSLCVWCSMISSNVMAEAASLSSCRTRQRRTILHPLHNKTRGRLSEPTKSEYKYDSLTDPGVNNYKIGLQYIRLILRNPCRSICISFSTIKPCNWCYLKRKVWFIFLWKVEISCIYVFSKIILFVYLCNLI